MAKTLSALFALGLSAGALVPHSALAQDKAPEPELVGEAPATEETPATEADEPVAEEPAVESPEPEPATVDADESEEEPRLTMDDPIPPPPPSREEDGDFPQVLSSPEELKQTGPMRWTTLGGFIGMVNRPAEDGLISYRTGVAYGGFFRPQLFEWLAIRLSYREERIPVNVEPGGFDYGEDKYEFDFEQSDLRGIALGANIEPMWVIHPKFRLLGVLGVSWLRHVAEMPTAEGFDIRAKTAGVELNWTLGAGISADVIPNWLNFTVTGNYSFVSNQTGDIFDQNKPRQAVVGGEIVHLAPLPAFKRGADVLFALGLIL